MRSFTLGRIWGIPIRVNTSLLIFLPVLAWLIGSGGQIELYAGIIGDFSGVGFDLADLQAGQTPWVIGVAAAVGLFVSVTLHELGHSWVALRYDIEIESITLWILGGIASLKSVPREWDREFWIAIAGPAVSVAVGAACYVGVVVAPASLPVTRFVVGYLALTNLLLAGFNLLPAFPMDGGRVFRALLARSRPYGTATRIAARAGVMFALLFAVVGVLSFNIVLLLLAFFIYGAATTESRTVLVDELLEGVTVGDIMTREPATVDADATLAAFGDRLLGDRQSVHVVTDGDEILGVVALADLRRAKGRDHETTRVAEITREVPRVSPEADAFDTLVTLNEAGTTSALVEADGELIGVLTEADYAHVMSIRRGFQTAVAA